MEVVKDLRVRKTKKLVYDAMLNLVLRRRFEQITVYELCEGAQISRATFYVYFEDKYDLLRHWLTSFLADVYNRAMKVEFEKREEFINGFIYENKKIIENLLVGADNETLEIVFQVVCSFSNIAADKEKDMNKYVVLSNIYVGGIISYLRWQAKNKFPKEVPVVNMCLSEIVKNFLS